MKKNLYTLLLAFIYLSFYACTPDEPVKPDEPDVPTDTKGLSYTPAAPDADGALTISFNAPEDSQLYNYTGDVYVHIGVVSEGTWLFVPADWKENTSKCKMTSKGENSWEITLSPSIREWFGSGQIPVNQIGIVIRSADGSKKGIIEDSFISVTDSKYKGFEPDAVQQASLPAGVRHGINYNDNSTVTLVLYDKDKNGNRKEFAHVLGDFNDWTLSNDKNSKMLRDDVAGCWWITLNNLNPTREYAFQYYLGGKSGEVIRVADPYTEKIFDPNNDKYISSTTYPENKIAPAKAIGISSTFQIQQASYAWKVPQFEAPASDNLVIYELLLRDFTDSGDLNGAMQKLDYLQSLGVNAIELMPVQEFDGNDSWGYNPTFFFAMDKAYGTKTMYKEFVDACHARGMAVILDVVYNHATGANPFAKMWWNGAVNKTAAENPFFNVDAPHPYSVFHDFNHEFPLVRDFVKRNLEFLITEYNIDGFRFDLTKGFTQKKSSESTASNYDASRVAILKDYHAKIMEVKPNAYVILEHFCDDREERELTDAGMLVWGNKNEAYCETAMGWNTSSKTNFNGINGWTRNWSTNNVVGYMESHDEERTIFKAKTWGVDNVKNDLAAQMQRAALNAAFFFPIPGPKMIWQFGEMGYDISIDQNGRTGKKPILWNYLDVPERKGLHDAYQKLIHLRHDISTTFSDRAAWSMNVAGSDWGAGRKIILNASDKKMVIIGNFEPSQAIDISFNFPEAGSWQDVMRDVDFNVHNRDTVITVPAHQFRIFIQ